MCAWSKLSLGERRWESAECLWIRYESYAVQGPKGRETLDAVQNMC